MPVSCHSYEDVRSLHCVVDGHYPYTRRLWVLKALELELVSIEA